MGFDERVKPRDRDGRTTYHFKLAPKSVWDQPSKTARSIRKSLLTQPSFRRLLRLIGGAANPGQ